MRPLWPGFPIPQNPKYFSNLDIIALGGRQEALYGSNYSIICINYDLISVLVSKGKHADLEYEIICRPFRSCSKFKFFSIIYLVLLSPLAVLQGSLTRIMFLIVGETQMLHW